jgi:hypothetical protein
MPVCISGGKQDRTVDLRVMKTLGSYRDCPDIRGRTDPGSSGRGSFDRIVCTEPLAFAADAVIYLCIFNRAGLPMVAIVITELKQRSGKRPLDERS